MIKIENSSKSVVEYSVRVHGIMLPDYFQGQGISHTKYDGVSTGIGETAREAFEDALDDLAANGWNVSSLIFKGPIGRPLTVTGYLRSQGIKQDDSSDCSFWYVSVLVKGEGVVS